MIEQHMNKDINNNDHEQLNHLKRIHTLNSEYLTHRDHEDVRKQFERVKEVIDPTGNVSITLSCVLIYMLTRLYSRSPTKHLIFHLMRWNIFQRHQPLSILIICTDNIKNVRRSTRPMPKP